MDYNNEYPLLTDENHIYKSVNYDELMDLINGLATGIFYIGGSWCKNCQAIIGLLNETCKNHFIHTIYNFDSRSIGIIDDFDDVRDCKTLEDKLKYYDLVEKIGFNNTTDEFVDNTLISRMHLPFIFALKNGTPVDFFSMELVYEDNIYTYENQKIDRKNEFINRLEQLISKII